MMKNIFKFPRTATITSRTSTITNAFVNAIIPRIKPTPQQVKECLEQLQMDEKTIKCVYCGKLYTEWDHFRPVVREGLPTGYITDIYNLVPSCSTCNSSKGSKTYKEFLLSSSEKSPNLSPNLLQETLNLLEKYDKWSTPKTKFIDFKKPALKDILNDYLLMRDNINNQIKIAQNSALDLKKMISKLI